MYIVLPDAMSQPSTSEARQQNVAVSFSAFLYPALKPGKVQKIAQPNLTGTAIFAPNCTYLHLVAEKRPKTENFPDLRKNGFDLGFWSFLGHLAAPRPTDTPVRSIHAAALRSEEHTSELQ